ncbi:hypothetical protein [Virgibacillus sp. SK37]|uniref:hypothetical protein n=1 Tax=Virgibacillus sp. SK37 TaxID=403957 RepID=UPI0004D0E332|nr:hypothetical protein [Virgibacillus sp. SK37]AIF45549.1 hypothetical protein X953_16280 [Virgibacillus sp. SK37]
MELTKEQLLDDFSVLALSNKEVVKNDNIINSNNKAINEHIHKSLKKQLNVFLLASVFLLIFILPYVIGTPVSFVLIVVFFFAIRYCKKSLDNPNSFFGKSSFYSNQRSKILNKNAMQEKLKLIDTATQRNNQINQSLNEAGIFMRIPEQYTTYKASVKIFTYLFNSRADTLKEAINLFMQEEHQERMEAKQDYIINKTEQAAMDARAARIEASIAAAASQSAASYSQQASENSKRAVSTVQNRVR